MEQVHKFFSNFDEVFCINLDSRPDRWSRAMREFSYIGISSLVTRKSGNLPQRGESNLVGCGSSHVDILRESRNKGHERIFIFEDDFKFFDNVIEDIDNQKRLNSIFTEPKITDWDVIYIGGKFLPYRWYSRLCRDWCRRFNPSRRYIARAKSCCWGQSYAVNMRCADKIIAHWEDYHTGNTGRDWLYQAVSRRYNLKVFYTVPKFTGQSNIKGNIRTHNNNKNGRVDDKRGNE